MGFISANDQKISRETFETYFQTQIYVLNDMGQSIQEWTK